MANNAWRAEQESFRARLSELDVTPTTLVADRNGVGLLAHAEFAAGEGTYAPAPYLKLNLCTAHIGRMRRNGDGPTLEGMLRPGTVAIALPGTSATGFWPKTQMLGIAVSLDALADATGASVCTESLIPAASRLHDDPLLTSVMTALWRDAEYHGLSSGFFEQGLSVLINHLAHTPQPAPDRTYRLRGPKLQRVLDLIESRLGEDVRVAEMAALIGQEPRSFFRTFQATTGMTPYAYFTLRRMEFAKQLLEDRALSITDIAVQVGYDNPSKFAAAFRRTYGASPSVWRRHRECS